MYTAWAVLGVCVAALVRARLRDAPALPGEQRSLLLAAAVVGAVLGAYLLELPADRFGWTWAPAAEPGPLPWLAGRTVLGGLIGGWIAVEVAKWRLGVRQPTGDGFAAPLAAALLCGRLGCASAGCCAGSTCPSGWWAVAGGEGTWRWPVPQAEAAFHALALIALLLADRRGWLRGRRLAAYLLAYALLRIALETVRPHPPVLLGATWYQLLAGVLAAIAGITWWRRRAAAPAAAPGS